MIINRGLRSVNRYEEGRSLWKAMAIPYCLYGSEITHYREGDIAQLEKPQNIVGRWSLGVPNSTAVEAIRGEMGRSSFKERIEKGEFNLMKKIGLEEERWIKKILMERKDCSKWKIRVGRLEKEREFGGGVEQIRSKRSQEKSRGEWQREMETGWKTRQP